MNLAKVIGTLWATQKVEGLEGATFLWIQPVDGSLRATGEPIVAVDAIGAGRPGEIVFYITSYEAVLATGRKLVPVDAAICGTVDHVQHHGRQNEGIRNRAIDVEALL